MSHYKLLYSKHTLNKELITTFNSYLESLLAIGFLEEPQVLPSVIKVSQAILKLIRENQTKVKETLSSQKKIKDTLFNESFFGHLNQAYATNTDTVLEKICQVLSEGQDIAQLIHIHATFIQYMYDPIIQQDEKQDRYNKKSELVNTIFKNGLFDGNRGRIEKKGQTNPTSQLGILKNHFFEKKIHCSERLHLRAMDQFFAEENNQFNRFLDEHNLPFVAGPSGHTGSLLLGALLYSDLNQQQLKEYLLVVASTLIAGGNHSFSEVICVANAMKQNPSITSYKECLPQSFFASKTWQKLDTEYPKFLTGPLPTYKID